MDYKNRFRETLERNAEFGTGKADALGADVSENSPPSVVTINRDIYGSICINLTL